MNYMKKDYHQSTEIRNSYEILPLQGIWSWLTGKEQLGRKTPWESNSSELIVWSLLWVVIGLWLTHLAVFYAQSLGAYIESPLISRHSVAESELMQSLCWLLSMPFTVGRRILV
ncbi:hypothetical protein [Aeromonas salmonicida]|uniref:hypothetical protein n=1 Tax=Aeromonas salmonicida TaxID=645 RepID=UPI0038B904C2